jgi:hypothetical protein
MERRRQFGSVFTLSQGAEVIVETGETNDIESRTGEPMDDIYRWRD